MICTQLIYLSVDVGFGEWSPWSDCSTTCEGDQMRERTCFDYCNGQHQEVRRCVQMCPGNISSSIQPSASSDIIDLLRA